VYEYRPMKYHVDRRFGSVDTEMPANDGRIIWAFSI
jgi:hypothetical protein